MAENKLFVVASAGTHVALDTTAFNDQALSYKAMGIHAYIRTRRVGEITHMPDLLLGSTDGDYAVRSGVKELLHANFLHLVQLRDEGGRLSSVVYVSMPQPVEMEPAALARQLEEGRVIIPYGDFPHTGNRDTVLDGPVTDEHNTFGIISRDSISYTLTPPIGDVSENKYGNAATLQPQNPEIEKLFILWNSLPALPTHRKGDQFKTYRNIVKALTKALRHHSRMVLAQAMENYNWLLRQPFTVMGGKKQTPFLVGLDQFFGFNNYNQVLVEKEGHPLFGVPSWFVESKMGTDHLLDRFGKLVKDKNPKYTEALTKAIRNCPAFAGLPAALMPRDQSAISLASVMLIDWIDQHKARLDKRNTVSTCINRLLMMLNRMDKRLHLGYLTSDITWSEFGTYMEEMGVLAPTRHSTRRDITHGTGTAAGKS